MALRFADYGSTMFAVTPSDANKLSADAANPNGAKYTAGSIYVGTQGDLEVVDSTGNTVILVGVQGFLPIQVIQVKASNTTATNIVALFKD